MNGNSFARLGGHLSKVRARSFCLSGTVFSDCNIGVCTFQKRPFLDLFQWSLAAENTAETVALTSLGDRLSKQTNSHSFSMVLPLK